MRGVLIALAGVLAVSPDAMLLRWMRSLGASSPDVAVAKYIGIIVIMLVLGLYRGTGNALVSPAHFLLSAASQLCYQLSFTFCLLLTDAATALADQLLKNLQAPPCLRQCPEGTP